MTRSCVAALAVSLMFVLPVTAKADIGLTYLGAFRALPGTPSVYGDMTLYPAGNGGAGSLFLGSTTTGTFKVYEISLPAFTISTDVNALNTATTLTSFPISQPAPGLVWRPTDDRLYYSTTATSSQSINFRSINRDGTAESAVRSAPAWQVGGFGLALLPDAWAATYAAGKNILTIGPLRGPHMPAVDPWNSPVGITPVVRFNTDMTSTEFGDMFNSMAWVEAGSDRSVIVGGYDKSALSATLWFLHVADIEVGTASNPPQPYKVLTIENRMLTATRDVFGMAYDPSTQILYTAEGGWNKPTVIHGWLCADVPPQDDPPTAVIDLVASQPTLTSATLAWSAPYDDRGTGNKAAAYDVRYSTAMIDDTNWDSAAQATGEPTPSAMGAPETFVVTGLAPETTYFFAVKSTDLAAHVSAISNVVSQMTLAPDRIAPAQVTDLAAVNVQSGQLLLRWTARGDDDLTGMATGYTIRYSASMITEANFPSAFEVPQSLTPQAPGQTESLMVTGLVPSTTYYFAIKVSDEVPNQSVLSNVVQVTTQLPDQVAPAAVTDLAAGGSDALGATLTWTATGDDGTTGTASSYQIRYSLSAISEAEWATATPLPNLLVPQAAGSTETFAAIGLQPSTTYYFALKVMDEENNISALSNVVSHTTAPLTNLPTVTTVTLVDKGGATTNNYPVTLSMVFKKGDVADHVTVRAGGIVLPTQTDVKVRWPDASVRHALVSFVLPQMQANQTQVVEILSGGPAYSTGWVTKEQLLGSDFEALMGIVVGSTRADVSARQMLQATTQVEYWMQGPIATEFVIRDWNSNYFNQLNVSYRVRLYPGAGIIRVSTVVDNTWINARGNITYDVTLALNNRA